jgi:hypothetical protein
MFCANCGKAVAEGLAFCTSCGSPAPKDSPPAAIAPEPAPVPAPKPAVPAEPAAVPAPDATLVPVAAAAAPTEVRPVISAAVVAPAPVPAPAPAPEPGGPVRATRTGLIVGSVLAAVVVLAGAGVGLYFGLKGDSGLAATTTTTAPDASMTTQTIPSVDGVTESTAQGGDVVGPYRAAVQDAVMQLQYANARIPELADTINSTTPDVPEGVYQELNDMLSALQTAYDALVGVTPPPGLGDATGYLVQATDHMFRRIAATIEGVQAGWDSGTTSAALPFYADGRDERDAYLVAMDHFYDEVPEDMLPGD